MKVTLKRTAPNYRQKLSTIRIMQDLMIGVIALAIISIILNFVNFGSDYGIKAIAIFVTSVIVALITDSVCGKIFKRNDKGDNKYLNTILSPVVTSVIFALTLPVGTPLYVVGVGAFISILFGKAIYGGFGSNIFNPALVGRVVVHLSFGSKLVTYLPGATTDLVSTATPATAFKAVNWIGSIDYSLTDLFTGNYMSALGEGCTIAILVIGVIFAIRKVLDWRIPVAYLGTAAILVVVNATVSGINPINAVLTHLAIGGIAFGAVFMATDPVTSPTSPLGKIIFGICLGFMTMLIRFKGNYPEGVLFAILFMNMFVPFIDNMTVGRTNKNQVKQWISIVFCLVIASGTIFGASESIQNDIAEAKAKEELALKKKEEAEKKKAEEEANAFNWKVVEEINGGYIMETTGFKADKPMQIKVMVDKANEMITSIEFVSYEGETEYYGKDLIEGSNSMPTGAKAFYDQYLTQSFKFEDIDGVDTKTGATMTTKGIVNAIKGAIVMSQMEREVNGNLYTYTIVEQGYKADQPMTMKITVDKSTSTVKGIEFISYDGETEYYGKELIEGTSMMSASGKAFYDKYLSQEFKFEDIDGVDTKTGATMTTNGIVKAIRKAIAASK